MTDQAKDMLEKYINQLRHADMAVEVLDNLVARPKPEEGLNEVLELRIYPNSSEYKAAGTFLKAAFAPLAIVKKALDDARSQQTEAKEQIKKWAALV